MSEREELVTFLGLPPGASLSEIERAFSQRYAAVGARLSSGDESARVELVALREAYERFTGRKLASESSQVLPIATGSGALAQAPPESLAFRRSRWWEPYLSLLLALASTAALIAVVLYLPQVYRRGGFLVPVVWLLVSAILSIGASMAAEAELQQGWRRRLLARKGLEPESELPMFRWRLAWTASLLSRAVRWLIVLTFVATVLLNFAALSGRWSLRR